MRKQESVFLKFSCLPFLFTLIAGTIYLQACTQKISKERVPYFHLYSADSVAGNDSVPSVHWAEVAFKKTIVARLKYQADILDGLKVIAEQEKIKNAVIVNGIGSVYQYHVHSVSNSTFPSSNNFFKKEDPNDLVSLSGFIIDGRVHAHVLMSNGITAVGGHLEPGTLVFTFCVVTIGIIDDEYSLSRFDDKTWR